MTGYPVKRKFGTMEFWLALLLLLLLAQMYVPGSAKAAPAPILNYNVNQTFNGTSNFVDISSDIGTVSGLTQGSILATFKTTNSGVAKALFSAAHTADDSSNLTLSVNGGNLHYENRENGTYAVNATYTGTYNDGFWHTAVVTVGPSGTKMYIDGYQVTANTSSSFFPYVTGINGMYIGKNVDVNGSQWYYAGDIGTVQVYNTALSAGDVSSLSLPAALKSYAVNQSFNGTSDFVDKTADLSAVAGLTQGTIVAKFQTTSAAVAKTILSITNKAENSSNATLSINGGNLHFESRKNGTYSNNITVNGSYNDGKWHTVAVAVGSTGTQVYIDGVSVGSSASTGFFSTVTGASGMYLGKNIDVNGSEWYFAGSIESVGIYSQTLNGSQIKMAAGIPGLELTSLYDQGFNGSAGYRIPSLITTKNGTLLSGIDARINSSADSPNNIDFTVRRSTDNGATWSAPIKVLDYPGSGADGASAIDSCLLQDEATGTIWVLIDHFPGGIGQSNAALGTGFDANGYKLLYDGANNSYTLRANGQVYDSGGTLTSYVVDASGNVTLNGAPKGNIYLKKGVDPNESLLEARTAFLVLLKSDDDGLTWSKPIDLNPQVKASWMKFIGASPGNGIQLKGTAHNGRLVFPIYYSNSYYNSASPAYSNAVIYSDDHGATWQRGASPNDGRVWNGATLSSQTLTDKTAALHESQMVEQDNGYLRVYMRNSSGNNRVAVATSTDGGATWGSFGFDSTLLDPFCQSTVIKYPDLGDGKSRVIFANPASTSSRSTGTVRLSEDGGVTWKYSKVLKSGYYGYSALTVLPGGDLAIAYEDNYNSNFNITYTTFPLSWISSP